MTAFLQDGTLINDFINETEIDFLGYITSGSGIAPDATSIYLPRIKLGDAAVGDQPVSGRDRGALRLQDHQ